MFPEIERFGKWLHCQSPQATTHIHYTSDTKLFLAWVDKPMNVIAFHDVDDYVDHYRGLLFCVLSNWSIHDKLAARGRNNTAWIWAWNERGVRWNWTHGNWS